MTEPQTELARYMEATGTQAKWLPKQVGVSGSKVSRWMTGATGMRDRDKERVMEVLRERAAVSLDGLLDDQKPFNIRTERAPRRLRRDGTSYDRFLAEHRAAMKALEEP